MRLPRKLQLHRRQPGRAPILSTLLAWTVVSTLVHLALFVFYGIRRYGKEHVTPEGPAIYVANHQSHLDPPIVGVLIADRPFTSLARASLFKNKFFAAMIRWLGAVPLEQGKGDTAAIKTALAELEAGRRILIFPEGSRTPDGTLQPFQRGVLLLIKRAKVPVIPIALDGAFDIWPAHEKLPRLSGRIGVVAGEPIDPEEILANGSDEALELLRRRIETMRLALRQEMRNCTGGRWPCKAGADEPYWQAESQRSSG